MSIHTLITTIFAKKPYILTMSLVPDAVQMTITRDEKAVPHHDLLRANALPSALHTFLQQQPEQAAAPYLLPFPLAHQLRQALTSAVSDTFQLHTQALDALRIVDCPPDFQIVWHYDAARQVLERQLQNGVQHLGAGWFTQHTSVWQLHPPPSQQMRTWLGKPVLTSGEIGAFLLNGLRSYQSSHLRCDLRLETGFAAMLRIIAIDKHSLDVQLVSNMPDIQRGLQSLPDDQWSLISGTVLLPRWFPRLRGRLLALARSGTLTRIAGDDLLAFLQDDLAPNAATLRVDLARLQAAFPIHDGARMPITWQLDYVVRHGIGGYWAVPYLGEGAHAIALPTVLKQFNAGARFVRIGDAWLEYTPAFKEQCARWRQQNAGAIQLAPSEVLGSSQDRLTKLRLAPPQIVIPDAETETEQLHQQMATLRQHGLPVGIAGLQQEVPTVLAQTCLQVLQKYSEAPILWLVPRSKHAAALKALQHAAVPTTKKPAAGHVLLATPEIALPKDTIWTLIIFSELDLLAGGSKQAQAFATLKRRWSISTFARPNWYQREDRAALVLQALGLRASDRDAFVQHCLRTYTDQPDSLLTRIPSPFKGLFIGGDSDTAQAGVPIPPRDTPSALRPVPHASGFRSDFTDFRQFLKEARRLVNQPAPPAEYVPFVNYWPTYAHMNPAQQQWYFYWRSQVRVGQYPATDLSYIFVHVYEELHPVGFDTPQQAFVHLVRLWQQYRPQHPKLDTYLVDWLADFLVVHHLPKSPLDWYAWVLTQGGKIRDVNLAVEAWLSSSSPIDQIPDGLLWLVSTHNPTKNKFYQLHNTDGAVNAAYRRGLAVIDAAVREAHGKSLFEYYRPTDITAVCRQPFASAVYSGKRTEIQIATVTCWANATEFRSIITSILKYTENRLRRQHQFKSTLKKIELPQEWMTLLDETFPIPESAPKPARKQRVAKLPSADDLPAATPLAVPKPPIAIDMAKVSAVDKESDAVRNRLTVAADAADKPAAPATPATPVPPVPIITPLFNLERPEDTPEQLLTDLHEVAMVLGDDADALALLRFLQSQAWEVDSERAAQTLDGTFLTVVLDRLNDRAIEELGDKLIFEEGGTLVVAEDYRDELEHLFTHPIPMSAAPDALDEALHDLAPEWAAFVQQLQPHHWETLVALLAGVDVSARLAGIAQSVQHTPDLLIDDINEYAQVHIGDIIIEAGDPPLIEEEDYKSVQSLVAWALQHKGVMA